MVSGVAQVWERAACRVRSWSGAHVDVSDRDEEYPGCDSVSAHSGLCGVLRGLSAALPAGEMGVMGAHGVRCGEVDDCVCDV